MSRATTPLRKVVSAPMADDDAARKRAEAFVRRSYRTARIPPLIGIKEVLLVLDIDKATIYRWMKPGSGLLGPDRTHMIPPAIIGGGDAYAQALLRRADELRREADELQAAGDKAGAAKVAKKFDAVTAAASEAQTIDAGRPVWSLDDVERFGQEIGRIRAPVGKAKARR